MALPQAGDIVVWTRRQAGDATGHVAYVEAVNPDRSITISEMNSYFGIEGGDWHTMSPQPYEGSSDGWEGLNFIHRPGVISPSRSPSAQPTQATTPRAVSAMRADRLRLARNGRRITLTIDLLRSSGTARVLAQRRHRMVHLDRSGGSGSPTLAFSAILFPGRWRLTVIYQPASGSPPGRHAT
jgi:hypothetical protein